MRYTLDEIETFLAVMELGSVTAASARLNLSKSVVSKRITDLERALGAALFLRSAGRIAPTEAALRLTDRLRPALSDLRAAAESAAWEMDGAAPLRGRLAISVPMSFGMLHLGPILARFAAAHPGLDLRIDYDDRAHDLVRDGYDLAIRIGEARDAALIGRLLCTDRMIACASPEYLSRQGRPRSLADLAAHQVIGYSLLSDARLWQFTENGAPVTVPVSSRVTLNNGEAMRDFALAGLGLAMLPGFIAAPEIATGRLEQILPDHPTRALPIHALWPPVSPMPAKLRALVDHLSSELSGGRPWTGGKDG
ncbi:LysR family transcriptional regulator [Szabonella alba]|uniref:LysR family transcriptional regulator n=1 Tax=Szabonella alba TaxID=2804194 RepID=A0A8K0VDZ4_9RHOB|nr:LysR family transcriptional regulator [Szabonella alba]MBL4918463.1 LysR family transcriptional regulator [Szabonella alba]